MATKNPPPVGSGKTAMADVTYYVALPFGISDDDPELFAVSTPETH